VIFFQVALRKHCAFVVILGKEGRARPRAVYLIG
jgi:hypothetical protein